MKELKIFSPCGILGYGFPESSFLRGLEEKPDLIAVDAGSTDAGPHKLGAGVGIVSVRAVKKDLELILMGGAKLGIPVVIGSAGGAGAKAHIDWTMPIIEEIIAANDYKFKMAVIHADVDRDYIKKRMKEGKVQPLGPVPELTEEDLDQTNSVVGQMGIEPIIEALENGADLVLAGRAYDPSCFAAYPIMKGYDPALSFHLGKILECGALCADPGTTKDCIMGYLGEDYFEIESSNPERLCHTTSVAAHTLYEKSHPYILYGPGFTLDLGACKFEQVTPTRVRVTGSKLQKAEQYTIKLEGAAQVAYRTIVVAGVRDPLMIEVLEKVQDVVVKQVQEYFSDIPQSAYDIIFHNYGIDGVMGPLEPVKDLPHEVGVVIDVLAKTQELANTICSSVRSSLLHFGYPGRKATAGNLAFPFAPSDIECGPVYKFTVYHLVDVDDPKELFPITYKQY